MASGKADVKQTGESVEAGTAAESAQLDEFGRRLTRLREAKGWSRSELALRLGISRQRLRNWELGLHPPPFEALLALKRLLGVPLDELIAGEKPHEGLSRDRRYQALKYATELLRTLR